MKKTKSILAFPPFHEISLNNLEMQRYFLNELKMKEKQDIF